MRRLRAAVPRRATPCTRSSSALLAAGRCYSSLRVKRTAEAAGEPHAARSERRRFLLTSATSVAASCLGPGKGGGCFVCQLLQYLYCFILPYPGGGVGDCKIYYPPRLKKRHFLVIVCFWSHHGSKRMQAARCKGRVPYAHPPSQPLWRPPSPGQGLAKLTGEKLGKDAKGGNGSGSSGNGNGSGSSGSGSGNCSGSSPQELKTQLAAGAAERARGRRESPRKPPPPPRSWL
jgi:hypothetical protein